MPKPRKCMDYEMMNFIPIEKRAHISENYKCCSWWRFDGLVSPYTRDGTVDTRYLLFAAAIFNQNKKI